MHYWGHPFMGSWGFGIGSFFGIVVTILFWLFIAFLIVAIIKGFRKHGGDFDEKNSGRALDILKERYAKGEINKKEFDEMKKDIA